MKHDHERRSLIPLHWPAPPLRMVLLEPEIPQNTGNIARLCAATGTPLHLVGPLGFHLTSSKLKRAGIDYWDSVELIRHTAWEPFIEAVPGRHWYLSTRGQRSYSSVDYQPGDCLVFGSESRGLPEALLDREPEAVLAIPIRVDQVRSLNLATAAGIVLYEALRQLDARHAGSAPGA